MTFSDAPSALTLALAYEQMLVSRYAVQGTVPKDRHPTIDRSATVLLARLASSGPMSVGELAEAFGLDVSTVHRQLAAAMKSGLIERITDPDGGSARKHRPTTEGARRLEAELAARADIFARATADWAPSELQAFVDGLRRFNEGLEAYRGHPWPRPEN